MFEQLDLFAQVFTSQYSLLFGPETREDEAGQAGQFAASLPAPYETVMK